jgi:pilus assembly protein CpaB
MSSRIVAVIVAVALGVAAWLLAVNYLNGQQQRITAGAQLVTVLVAKQDLPTGMTADEMLSKGYVAQEQIPRQYVAGSAVSSLAALQGKVAAQPISKDEQIADTMFKYAADVGLASSTPKGYVAVSMPYDAARGVGTLLRPGDSVAVFGTFASGATIGIGGAVTKLVLPKVKVLAIGAALAAQAAEAQSGSNSGGILSAGQSGSAGTVTLAVTPADAEKLVFTLENGTVWLGLFSPTDPDTPNTSGVGLSKVLR